MLSIVMPEEEKETYVNGQLLQETMQDVPSALLQSKQSQGFKVMKFWRLFFCLWVGVSFFVCVFVCLFCFNSMYCKLRNKHASVIS